jgi:hypothetical protein
MVALSETIVDHAKRLVRQRLAETPEAAILMSAAARATFLGNVDTVLAAAASPWTAAISPPAFLNSSRRFLATLIFFRCDKRIRRA